MPEDAGVYRLTASLPDGRSTFSTVRLVVTYPPPRFVSQPLGGTYPEGTPEVRLRAEVSGASSLQWFRNGNPIPGADQAVLVFAVIRPTDAGSYTLRARNADGVELVSAPAVLTVDPLAPGGRLWEFKTGAGIGSCPALGTNGMIYVGSDDRRLYAIDASTGVRRWEFATGGRVYSSPAIGPDGTVYVGSEDKKVYAVDGTTGVLRWEFLTGGAVFGSPAIGADGTVFVGSEDQRVHALGGKTGVKRWEFATGGGVSSSPAIGADGTVYVGSTDKTVYALDGASGNKRWGFVTGGPVYASPAVGPDGTVYVGSEDKRMYALNGATGQKRWELATGGALYGSPVVGGDGRIFFGSDDKKLYAVDGMTGSIVWTFASPGAVRSTPAVGSDGTVYVGSDGKLVHALDGRTGLKVWDHPVGSWVSSSPVIGTDGVVYIGAGDGRLLAVASGSPGLAASAWPMFRADRFRSGRIDASLSVPSLRWGLVAGGQAVLEITAMPGGVLLQRSLDLRTWTEWSRTNMPPEGRLSVPIALGEAKAFYRAIAIVAPVGPAGFVWIPPGTFVMGSPPTEEGRDSDEIQHTVTLTQGFWLSDHEVTQAEYRAVMGNNPSVFNGDTLPVESVSWEDAVLYCQKLTERERASGRITAQQAYRLPTEAEWEYAARAGTTGARHGDLDAIAWYSANSGGQTRPVKQKQPNAWGLHDMLGNVWEWCGDWYGAYPTGSVTDPPSPGSGSYRVYRGGSWIRGAGLARSASRNGDVPGFRSDYLGFRPALSSVR
jgi:outer membrane protein assembly factor BamB